MKPGIEGAAEALWQARSERKTIARVSETFDIQTVQDAYAIAEVNVSRAATPSVTEPNSNITGGVQMSFFQLDDPVLSDIRERLLMVDINSLTPLEALNKLSEIQRLLKTP